jgi:hypothetical protein
MRRLMGLLAVTILLIVVTAVPGGADHTPEHSYAQLAAYCETHDTGSCDTFWAAHDPTVDVGVAIGPQAWADEFTAPTLDLSKWEPSWFESNADGFSGGINSAMDNCYDEDLVGILWGSLLLSSATNADPDCERRDGATAPYRGSVVTTRGNFGATSGVWEAKVNYAGTDPCGGGGSDDVYNWQSFWTDPLQSGNDDEVDVAETGSSGTVRTNIHYDAGSVSSDDWCGVGGHTYTLLRTGSTCKIWVDGTLNYTSSVCSTFSNDPHVIIFDQSFDTARANTSAGETMQVKWVRYWPLA